MYKENKLKFALYCLVHPLDGFYEIRHRGKGSVGLAFLLLIMFGISFSFNKHYASFIVNPYNPLYSNSLTDMLSIILLFLLFAVSNWSVTCLMEGEGRFKDIVTITGYSLLPLVLTFIPVSLLSHLLAANEEAFYYLLMGIAYLWFGILILTGIMIIHNFTIGKTILTGILTFAAMAVLLFLSVLLISMLQQVILFFKSIYTELVFSA